MTYLVGVAVAIESYQLPGVAAHWMDAQVIVFAGMITEYKTTQCKLQNVFRGKKMLSLSNFRRFLKLLFLCFLTVAPV